MATTELAVRAGTVTRDEFGATQLQGVAETAATAVAARAKAEVEARFIMALRRPREIEECRVKLLKECDRPGFAEVARFKKPIGGSFVEGPSIRFAEAALRCLGNIFPEATTVYEDAEQRIIRISVTDLEANLCYASEVVVKKTVERRNPKQGVEVISSRKNSNGDTVYLVSASEDEVLVKQNALISKALRTNGLRLLPGDILDECMQRIKLTLSQRDKANPDEAKRRIIDAFSSVGVTPTDLQAFLGHSLDRIQPAELTELREVYQSIKDGEATWDQVMEAKDPVGGSKEEQERVAQEKIARLEREKAEREKQKQQSGSVDRMENEEAERKKDYADEPLSEEEMRAADKQQEQQPGESPKKGGFSFGRPKQ